MALKKKIKNATPITSTITKSVPLSAESPVPSPSSPEPEPPLLPELPLFPEKIGLITSTKGSVINDIINILNRRAPYINIFIRDCQVQGDSSSKSIINGIYDFELFNKVDLLIMFSLDVKGYHIYLCLK